MMTPVKKSSAIRPVEFYGNSLPRPRFFDNPKFNSHRVDPPLSVLDPLLSWAREAHWSMGGLNFTRLRLQGRIEGNVDKLRAQLEKSTPTKLESGDSDKKKKRSDYDYDYDSPPAAPVAVKRRRYIDLNADDGDDEEIGSGDEGVARIRRKLSDDFDRVAGESKIKASKKSIELGLVGKRLKEKKNTQKVEETSSPRTSPRLAKRSSC
ncbi:BnaA02g22070D [Brassica napus]|uniref:BnaA02g22070D protein n=1 Tax=Brassica napus TaxID=3708 RepID=A0A078GJ00_BRANA|nr:BnaA02g22070D [Brassica napus]